MLKEIEDMTDGEGDDAQTLAAFQHWHAKSKTSNAANAANAAKTLGPAKSVTWDDGVNIRNGRRRNIGGNDGHDNGNGVPEFKAADLALATVFVGMLAVAAFSKQGPKVPPEPAKVLRAGAKAIQLLPAVGGQMLRALI